MTCHSRGLHFCGATLQRRTGCDIVESVAAKKRAGSASKDPTTEELVDKAVRRFARGGDRPYFRALLLKAIESNALPAEVLESVPVPALEGGKTRFDQIFDAMMFVAFPGYREETLQKLLGPLAPGGPDVKIWRVIVPPQFKVAHVLIRASSMQEAFALGCDYACRMSVRLYGKVPHDLTVRIQFVSEKAVRRILGLRWANRVIKRRTLQLVGRVFTKKEVCGAKSAALGHPDQLLFPVARYAEARDLKRLLMKRDVIRISSIEHEVLVRADPGPVDS